MQILSLNFAFHFIFFSFDGHSYIHYLKFCSFHHNFFGLTPVSYFYRNFCLPQSTLPSSIHYLLQASLVQEIITEIDRSTTSQMNVYRTRQQIKINL